MIDVKNKNITVLGAGKSGIAVVELLSEKGAYVLLSDNGNRPKNLNLSSNIQLEFGKHSKAIYNCDFAVISPGIPRSSAIIKKFGNIPVYSEIEVASWFLNSPIIAITGSNGKTTTTALTVAMLNAAGFNAIACGNIGLPLSKIAMTTYDNNNIVVVELSSFQLESIKNFHPCVSTILNLVPDHLDRYPDFDTYCYTKMQIAKNLSSDEPLIINNDDKKLMALAEESHKNLIFFSLSNSDITEFSFHNRQFYQKGTPLFKMSEIRIKGLHNAANILAALTICSTFGVNISKTISAIKKFESISHRLEPVKIGTNIRVFNDSKATNTDSVGWALRSFDEKVILLMGGKAKENDFSHLHDLINKSSKRLITFGVAREKIASDIGYDIPTQLTKTLEEAVNIALFHAKNDDIILLSPGCTSFDEFSSFEERGDFFKKLIMENYNV